MVERTRSVAFAATTRGTAVIALASMTALILLAWPLRIQGQGQPDSKAAGERLLKGAIDMHWHMDPPTPTGGSPEHGTIDSVRIAKSRGLRGVVVKHHDEPTTSLAYLLRQEVPGFEIFGGLVLNLSNGGINPAAVEFMATQIKGAPGRVVWMPAGDSENEIKASRTPNRPFVSVAKGGALLPEVKNVISLIKKYNLTLASGHIGAEEALAVFREARSQGVQRIIATHAMDLAGKMTMDQMQEAVRLGAIIEFDFRKLLEAEGQIDAIRKLGPEHCFISEFWTRGQPGEYGDWARAGAFAAAMKQRGFTDKDLDLMLKANPAKLVGLPPL